MFALAYKLRFSSTIYHHINELILPIAHRHAHCFPGGAEPPRYAEALFLPLIVHLIPADHNCYIILDQLRQDI